MPRAVLSWSPICFGSTGAADDAAPDAPGANESSIELAVECWYFGPSRLTLVHVSSPMTMMSAVAPRRAGIDALMWTALFTRSASISAVVPERSSGAVLPVPVRSAWIVPDNVA